MTVTTDAAHASFSAAIRAATMPDHEAAESAGFMTALMKGELDRRAVALLGSRMHTVYATLEPAGRALEGDPIAGPFIDAALERTEALAADLHDLLGPNWRNEPEAAPSAAAARYSARIERISADPAAFVAHHYTRYLGDLSGGQAIGAVLRRSYNLSDGGAAFYTFDAIADTVAYKRRYRDRLDALPEEGVDTRAFIDEVKEAYRLNRALFAELDGVPRNR